MVTKIANYAQTTEAAPVSPAGWSFSSEVFAESHDLLVGTVTPPSPGVPFSIFEEHEFPGRASFGSSMFATEAELDGAYPAGNYHYDVSLGNFAGSTADVVMPISVYPTSVPAVSGPTFASLQGYDPSSPLTLHFLTFVPPTGFDESETVIRIGKVGGDADFPYLEVSGDPETFDSLEIPAGLLPAQEDLYIEVAYYLRDISPNAGFGGADGEVEFERSTLATFATVPELGSCAAAFPLLNILSRRRARS